jgi:hypothetical protein
VLARRFALVAADSGTPFDFSSSGRCCSKLTGRGGGAVFETTCRGAAKFFGATAGAWPPSTASFVGTTAAAPITLVRPTALAGITTELLPTALPEANVALDTPVTAPRAAEFS